MRFSQAFDLATLEGKAVTRTAWIEIFNPDDKLLYPYVIMLPRPIVPVAEGTAQSATEQARVIPAALNKNIERAIAMFGPAPGEITDPSLAKFTPSSNRWRVGWSPSTDDMFADDWVIY